MSSVQLLDDTRKINAILHKKNNGKVVFNDICEEMKSVLSSNTYVFSKKGKVLGRALTAEEEKSGLVEEKVGQFIDSKLNHRFTNVLSTKENVNLETLGFSKEDSNKYQAIITPIDIAGRRYGTLFMYRGSKDNGNYSIEDIILCEYGATVVGLEMVRSVSEESMEETRREKDVHSAFSTLSASELEAVISVFDELSGLEGILVASRVADRVGITRSVIVNALRKLESAGVIVSKSSGMKGTYIKVTNEHLFEELEEIRKHTSFDK